MLLQIISAFSLFGLRHDDDLVDRLHYFVTANVLVMFAMLTSFKQFGGKPIECMVPDMFPGAWEEYAENYCFVQNNYFLPNNNPVVPGEIHVRTQKEIGYYQWVPLVLLCQAASFFLPDLIWRCLSSHSGIKLSSIVELSMDAENYIENALRFHRRMTKKRVTPHKYLRFLNLPYSSRYVTTMYLFTKSLYLINVALQWHLMNRFLETSRYSYYGWGALVDILNGTSWQTTGVFPRVTLCDFDVRTVGSNVQHYTIQCTLLINLFNEKIFVLLWFWFFALLVITIISLIWWFCVMVFPWPALWFVALHLQVSEFPFDSKTSQEAVERFTKNYLRKDGLFVLRMITTYAGVVFASELLLSMWCSYFCIDRNIAGSTFTSELSLIDPTARDWLRQWLQSQQSGVSPGPSKINEKCMDIPGMPPMVILPTVSFATQAIATPAGKSADQLKLEEKEDEKQRLDRIESANAGAEIGELDIRKWKDVRRSGAGTSNSHPAMQKSKSRM